MNLLFSIGNFGKEAVKLAVIGQFRVFEVVTGLLIASGSIAFSCFFRSP